METKSVFLKIGTRNKKILIASNPEKSDWTAIREAIASAAVKEEWLRLKSENCNIIFQAPCLKKNGETIMVDVDETDQHVEDECELSTIFERKEILTTIHASQLEEGVLYDIEDFNETFCGKSDGDSKLNFTPKVHEVPSDISLFGHHDPSSTDEGINKVLDSECLVKPSAKPAHEEPTSSVTNKEPQATANKRKTFSKPISVEKQTCDLPPPPSKDDVAVKRNPSWTEDQYWKKVTARYVNYYGHYLYSNTKHSSVRIDYASFAAAICTRHESLKDKSVPKNEKHIIQSQLSTFVRNRRSLAVEKADDCSGDENIRPKEKKKKSSTHELDSVPVFASGASTSDSDTRPATLKRKNKTKNKARSSTSSADHEDTSLASESDSDEEDQLVEKAVAKLKELEGMGATPNVIRLMDVTFKKRKKWIAKSSKGVQDIITVYPHLTQPELVLNELKLRVGLDVDTSLKKLKSSLQSFAEFLGKPFGSSEEESLDFLKFFYQYLKPKNFSKNAQDAIVLCEAFDSEDPSILRTFKEDSPRMVVFTKENNEVATTYIVAEGCISMHVDSTSTVLRSFLILLACYYAYDIHFPAGYRGFFFNFHEDVFNLTPSNPSVAYRNFRRSYLMWKNK